jgi:hypothetical protein
MDIRGVYGFSSLMKQNKKAKICFVIHIAGEKQLLFYIYFVIVKQKIINGPLITTFIQPSLLPFPLLITRPAIIPESQQALKFRVNRPRPRSQPARAGRACVLVVYFFSQQLGQL